jgi:DNA ligase-1
MMTWPTLYAVASTGKIKEWSISVVDNGADDPEIVVDHGYVGATIKEDRKAIRAGKNVGKANETSKLQQAVLEAQAKFVKKQDGNYVENIDQVVPNLLPMLAHPYGKRGHNIVWPCYVQPKLDGVRCLAEKISETEIKYTSRTNKPYTTLDRLTPYLLRLLDVGDIADGEVYNHTEMTFQELISAVKKHGIHTAQLQYWVYDLVDLTNTGESRISILADRFETRLADGGPVRSVPTIDCDTEDMMKQHYDAWVAAGYEGIMLRNKTGMYCLDYRSPDLQKYKEFVDAEFEIVGSKDGDGREEGKIIFTCKTADGQTFDTRPRGSMEMRARWWSVRDSFVGQYLTVRYQKLSDSGVPIFPVGITVRSGSVHNGVFVPDM